MNTQLIRAVIIGLTVLGLSFSSTLASPMPEGKEFCIQSQLVQNSDGKTFESLIQPGDILVFTGKPAEKTHCGLFEHTVVVIDPTHQNSPMLVSVLVGFPIPAGTRAELPSKSPECRPQACETPGYGGPVSVVTK